MISFNWQVVGHHKILNYLQTIIKNGRLNHAYLFWGPAGIGKSLVADYFIRSIYCESDEVKPCGSCVHCRQIEYGAHPDIIHLVREEDKKKFTVEQVRKVRSSLQHGTFLNSHKVVLIEGVEFMSLAATNSLLKILEEPLGKTVFILLAETIENIPATIISRLYTIKFLPVSREEIRKKLIVDGINRSEAGEIAHLTQGIFGRFKSSDLKKSALTEIKEKTESILDFLNNSLAERFMTIELLAAQTNSEIARINAKNFLFQLKNVLRDLILIKSNNFDNITHTWATEKILPISANFSLEELYKLIGNINRTEKLIDQNINVRLALENIAIRL